MIAIINKKVILFIKKNGGFFKPFTPDDVKESEIRITVVIIN